MMGVALFGALSGGEPLCPPLMPQGDHVPDAGWQVVSLFNDGAPGGPHGGMARRVQGQGIVKGPHVLPVEGQVALRLHVIGPGGPLGIDVKHEEAVKPVVQGHTFHRLQGVVQVVRGGGGGVDAHADQRLLAPGAQNITVFGIGVRHIEPAAYIVIRGGAQGGVQRRIKQLEGHGIRGALWNMGHDDHSCMSEFIAKPL